MASSFVEHVRAQLRDGASFLSEVRFSPAMLAGSASADEWLVAIENLYHGMLCLLAAEVSLTGAAPLSAAEVQLACQRGAKGALFRELIDELETTHGQRISQMSAPSRLALLSTLLHQVSGVYANVAVEQEDWTVDPLVMDELDTDLHRLNNSLLGNGIGIRLPF